MTKKIESGLGWKMWLGIGTSFLYACAAVFILVMNLYYSPHSPPMGLNEIGDYLAGAFSPLAFFWLVIGYFMQSRELNFTRDELKLTRLAYETQVDEVKKSVQLTKDAFDFNKAIQMRIYKDSHEINQPRIKNSGLSYHASKTNIELINLEDIYEISLNFDNESKEFSIISIISSLTNRTIEKNTYLIEGYNEINIEYREMNFILEKNNFVISNKDQLLDTIEFSYIDTTDR